MPDVLGRPLRTAFGLLLCGPAALAGCFHSLPPRELYRLGVPAVVAPQRAPAASAPVLTVASYVTPGVYAGAGIVYRVGDARYGTYPTREWALPLGAMLAGLTAESLAQLEGSPARVQQEDEAGAPGGAAAARGLVWRGVVREFEEVDRGTQVSAAVQLDVRLVRAADDSAFWVGSTRIERPVAPATAMTAVVAGLTDAARGAIADLVRQAAPALRAAAAAPPPASRH